MVRPAQVQIANWQELGSELETNRVFRYCRGFLGVRSQLLPPTSGLRTVMQRLAVYSFANSASGRLLPNSETKEATTNACALPRIELRLRFGR